jgi:hypothetical protein
MITEEQFRTSTHSHRLPPSSIPDLNTKQPILYLPLPSRFRTQQNVLEFKTWSHCKVNASQILSFTTYKRSDQTRHNILCRISCILSLLSCLPSPTLIPAATSSVGQTKMNIPDREKVERPFGLMRCGDPLLFTRARTA